MDKKEITLKHAIDVKTEGGNIVKTQTLTFSRLKMKHLKILPKEFYESEGEKIDPNLMIPLISALTGHNEETVGDIDLADLEHIGEELGAFLEQSLTTGKK